MIPPARPQSEGQIFALVTYSMPVLEMDRGSLFGRNEGFACSACGLETEGRKKNISSWRPGFIFSKVRMVLRIPSGDFYSPGYLSPDYFQQIIFRTSTGIQ